MISQTFTRFEVNGSFMRFDTGKFKLYFRLYCSQGKNSRTKIGAIEQQLGDTVHVSKDAVHQWRFGKSGPSSLEIIRGISEFFGLESPESLLCEVKERKKMNYSNEQVLAFKRIYDAIVEFLDEFLRSDGFNSLWFKFKKENDSPEMEIMDYADRLVDKIWLVYKKEYFFLHDIELYDLIGDYINDIIYDTYSGKCSYAYRFEAPNDGHIDTWDDYYNAIEKLNEIIDPIIS